MRRGGRRGLDGDLPESADTVAAGFAAFVGGGQNRRPSAPGQLTRRRRRAEFAVLPNGELYAGESAAASRQWRLGSALKDGADLRWERLDATTEMSCYSLKPPERAGCDWRYRCGGLDLSILQLEERVGPKRTNGGPSLRELDCAPRKRLFEELLWASLEAVRARTGTWRAGAAQPARGRTRLRTGEK